MRTEAFGIWIFFSPFLIIKGRKRFDEIDSIESLNLLISQFRIERGSLLARARYKSLTPKYSEKFEISQNFNLRLRKQATQRADNDSCAHVQWKRISLKAIFHLILFQVALRDHKKVRHFPIIYNLLLTPFFFFVRVKGLLECPRLHYYYLCRLFFKAEK